ncbi:NADP-dependent oxidoreductase [Kineosporia babensis]|uniref:NADP-dependent oxidoreductase n=1 Tax=Kineosporia babensis TaxID=499548 RepID=A0A9X1NMV5_9ACTN|nr:NADP-dependent oxidoreductase [Kineosporia babensis]MCD5317030.1 NADP-dependent oxidoreductase [Kineosporia babensis]
MKAVQIHEHGEPSVLRYEEVPVPALQAGEVLVQVHAVGLNPPDWYLREGMSMLPPDMRPQLPFPYILGTDISGVVVEVAEGVTEHAVGDEVFGMLRFPHPGTSAYAEYVAAPAAELARKPAGVSHAEAAAVAMSGLTAWQFLIELGHDHPNPLQPGKHVPVPLEAGMTVLVNGAAGGVGHLALQLARWKGARTIAVASARHEEFLRKLGADEYLDYARVKPEDVVRDVDLVVDNVGGPTSGRFLPTLKRGGALFPIFLAQVDPADVAKYGVTVSSTQVRPNAAQLDQIGRLLASGDLRVAIDSTFPLPEAAAAHERAENGHLQGKIVLQVI